MKDTKNALQTAAPILAAATFLLVLIAGVLLIADTGDAQSQVPRVIVQPQDHRVAPNETIRVFAYGMGPTGFTQLEEDGTVFMAISTVTNYDNSTASGDQFACWDPAARTWEVGSSPVSFNCRVEMELAQTAFFANITAPFAPTFNGERMHNVTIHALEFEFQSDLIVGNTERSGSAPLQLVDSKDQLFGHQPKTTSLEEFTQLTALELFLFPILALLGAILWSRSMDLGIRALGAFLAMFSGVLLLGFAINEGLGTVWRGTVPTAAVFFLAGAYMVFRMFTEEAIEGRIP